MSAAEIGRQTPINARLEKAALIELEALTPPSSATRAWKRVLQIRRALAVELTKLGREAGLPVCGVT